jgi:hypothetical protein
MARALKSLFERHADKRGIARRIRDGRFVFKEIKTTGHSNGIRIDLDTRHTAFFDPGSGKTRMYVRGVSAGQTKTPEQPSNEPFQNDVFASEAEYDRSVASVIARIKSGEVKPIEPDPE